MTAESNARILDIPALDLHNVPTVRDVDLGVRLGMARPATIRWTIEHHRAELEHYGVLHSVRAARATPKDGGDRDITEYHLKEPQALCLCQISRAPQAAAVRRMLITACTEWCQVRGDGDPTPAGLADVIAGPCSFPYLLPGNTRLRWQGHSISTDLSRLGDTRDVVALLPDGAIDIVRLVGPPCGVGGRLGITRRYLNPDIEDATPVMVIILGQIGSDGGRRIP